MPAAPLPPEPGIPKPAPIDTAPGRPLHGRSGLGSQSALDAWIDDMRRAERRQQEEERKSLAGKPGQPAPGL